MSPPHQQPPSGSNNPYTLVHTKVSPIKSKNPNVFTGDLNQLDQENMIPEMQNHQKQPHQGFPLQGECNNGTSSAAMNATAASGTYIWNHGTGSFLADASGNPVTVETFLNTKPLRNDLQTRPGPGGRKLTYVSGDVVTRTLNQAFGHDGWSFSILSTTKQQAVDLNKDESNKPPKWQVSYTSHVRISLIDRRTGLSPCFREDYGVGDSTDKCLATAIGNALKASITDGLKRAARLIGEKLGNSLYASSFAINKAPQSLGQALQDYQTKEQECQRQILTRKNSKQQPQNSAQDQEDQKSLPPAKPAPVEQEPKNEAVAEQQHNPYPNKAAVLQPQNAGVRKDSTAEQSNGSVLENPHNSGNVASSIPSDKVEKGHGQLHMGPPKSYTSNNLSVSGSEFPQSGTSRNNISGNVAFRTHEASISRQQNQPPLARVSDVAPAATRRTPTSIPPGATFRGSFDGSEMQSHQNMSFGGQKQKYVPRVSDVNLNPPQTSAQTMQSMFGCSNQFDEEGDEQWNKRPATATGQRHVMQVTAAKKQKTGPTTNPYQQQSHIAQIQKT